MSYRDVQVIQTKERIPTISVNKVLLHSKYYPSKEAEKFIQSNEDKLLDKSIVVIYGLAFGYHVQELLKRAREDCRIFIFDADIDIIEKGKELGVYNSIKNDARVRIFTGYSLDFFQMFHEKLRLVDDIIIYKPSVKVLPESFNKLKTILNSYDMSKIGIEKFGSLMIENHKENLKVISSSLKEFYKDCDIKNKPVIIVASGPSLDENIECLKKAKGKVKIFTVGSALRTLMNNGIKPGMVAIIDSQEIVKSQLRDFENEDIPLCFLNTASRWAVSSYNGPKYMFFNEKNEINDIIINTGKTVAVAAIDIAIKGGASKIILVGQDLAFVDNKTHTQSFVETYNMSNAAPKDDTVYKKIEGVGGTTLSTTTGFLYFKYCIEKEIEDNTEVEFINCGRGARIKGTKEKDLASILNDLS
ncbi:MAG: motility associated factor glycosyltransferase family protein [Clostridium lundense]|nr:motility associated factor glycosyltransferase family protein [Clostridium lundense]